MRTLHRSCSARCCLQRRFEERCAEAYALGKIGGFCHLYIGQEATGTGAISVLRDDDYVITTYRDHAQALARGISPRAVMAELFGKAAGCSHGKGGSMHLFSRERQLPGRPWDRWRQHPDRDGRGIRHQVSGRRPGLSLLLRRGGRQQWRVPRSPQHGGSVAAARGVSSSRTTATAWAPRSSVRQPCPRYRRTCTRVRHRACGRRRPGRARRAARRLGTPSDARATARTPTLIESLTYRFMGHSMSDAVSGTYRTKAEFDENLKRDPIMLLRGHMHAHGEVTDEEVARDGRRGAGSLRGRLAVRGPDRQSRGPEALLEECDGPVETRRRHDVRKPAGTAVRPLARSLCLS